MVADTIGSGVRYSHTGREMQGRPLTAFAVPARPAADGDRSRDRTSNRLASPTCELITAGRSLRSRFRVGLRPTGTALATARAIGLHHRRAS